MSLVVAVKHGGRIFLGADKQTTFGGTTSHVATKIWEMPELPGAIMGSVGSARASQVIQYNQILDKNILDLAIIDTDFIISVLAPSILGALKANGIKCASEATDPCDLMPNAFIFAYQDRAWIIWHDLSVIEISKYLAIGSGADAARGALYASADKTPFQRIILSINAAAETNLYVDDGINILTTREEEEDLVQLEAALNYLSAYDMLDSEVPKKETPKKTRKTSPQKTTSKSKSTKNKESAKREKK